MNKQQQSLIQAIEKFEEYLSYANKSGGAVPAEADDVANALQEVYELAYPE